MQIQRLQKIFQDSKNQNKEIGYDLMGNLIRENEASRESNGKDPIGISFEGYPLYKDLSEKEEREMEERRDRHSLDIAENVALKLANDLNLFDTKTVIELEQKALNGTLDKKTIEDIKAFQRALKEDGKYNGVIDGIPGVKSRQGLSDLVLENAAPLVTFTQIQGEIHPDMIQQFYENKGRER